MCALGALSLGAACWFGCEYAHSVVFSGTGFAGRRYGQRAVRRVRFGTRRLCESRCCAGRLDPRALVSRARERAGSDAQHAARPGHHQLGRARGAARARPELASSRECGRALARRVQRFGGSGGPSPRRRRERRPPAGRGDAAGRTSGHRRHGGHHGCTPRAARAHLPRGERG